MYADSKRCLKVKTRYCCVLKEIKKDHETSERDTSQSIQEHHKELIEVKFVDGEIKRSKAMSTRRRIFCEVRRLMFMPKKEI